MTEIFEESVEDCIDFLEHKIRAIELHIESKPEDRKCNQFSSSIKGARDALNGMKEEQQELDTQARELTDKLGALETMVETLYKTLFDGN